MSSYKTTCPNCNGRNLYVTPDNGVRFCFNCRYIDHSSKREKKQRYSDIIAIREYYTEVAQYYHSCLDERSTSFLLSRGIEIQTIEKYRLGYVPPEAHFIYKNTIAKEAGLTVSDSKPFLANRVVFPYIGSDGFVWDIRGRAIDPKEEIRYLSPKGSAYYRGADIVYNLWAFRSNRYVITEGEIKALVSTQVGIPCVAFPGMNSYRPLIQKEDQKRIICFDNQSTHRRELIQAISRLVYKIGFEDVYVATLLLKGKEKQDIDSYIVNYGVEAYKHVIDSALPFKEWLSLVKC